MQTFVSPEYSTDRHGRVRCVLTREARRRRSVGHPSGTPPKSDGPVLIAEPWFGRETRIRVRSGQKALLTALVDLTDESALSDLARFLAHEVVDYDFGDLELAFLGLKFYLSKPDEWPKYYADADGFWKVSPGNRPSLLSNFFIRWTRRTDRLLEGLLCFEGDEGSLKHSPSSFADEWSFRDFLEEIVPRAEIFGDFKDFLRAVDSVSVPAHR